MANNIYVRRVKAARVCPARARLRTKTQSGEEPTRLRSRRRRRRATRVQALAPPSAWVRRTIAVRELRIEVRERAQMDPDHLGGLTWTGGRALAEYVADRPALVAGKRVLELGCGSATSIFKFHRNISMHFEFG